MSIIWNWYFNSLPICKNIELELTKRKDCSAKLYLDACTDFLHPPIQTAARSLSPVGRTGRPRSPCAPSAPKYPPPCSPCTNLLTPTTTNRPTLRKTIHHQPLPKPPAPKCSEHADHFYLTAVTAWKANDITFANWTINNVHCSQCACICKTMGNNIFNTKNVLRLLFWWRTIQYQFNINFKCDFCFRSVSRKVKYYCFEK